MTFVKKVRVEFTPEKWERQRKEKLGKERAEWDAMSNGEKIAETVLQDIRALFNSM